MAEKTSTGGNTLYLRMQQVKDNTGSKNFGVFQYRKTAPPGGVPSNWFMANPAKPDGGYQIPHTITGTLYGLNRETDTVPLPNGKTKEVHKLVAFLIQEDGVKVNFEVGDLTYNQTEDFMLKLLCPEFSVDKTLFIDAYRNKNDYNTVVVKVGDTGLFPKEKVGDKWVLRDFAKALPELNMVDTATGKVADLQSQTARTKWLMEQLVKKFGVDFFSKTPTVPAHIKVVSTSASDEKFPDKEPVTEENKSAEQEAPSDDLPF